MKEYYFKRHLKNCLSCVILYPTGRRRVVDRTKLRRGVVRNLELDIEAKNEISLPTNNVGIEMTLM